MDHELAGWLLFVAAMVLNLVQNLLLRQATDQQRIMYDHIVDLALGKLTIKIAGDEISFHPTNGGSI